MVQAGLQLLVAQLESLVIEFDIHIHGLNSFRVCLFLHRINIHLLIWLTFRDECLTETKR